MQRLVVAAGAEAFDELDRVEHAGFVAHQHGVEHFVAQPGQARGDADHFFEHHCAAPSAANASASQPPVRWSVVMYSTLMRSGRPAARSQSGGGARQRSAAWRKAGANGPGEIWRRVANCAAATSIVAATARLIPAAGVAFLE